MLGEGNRTLARVLLEGRTLATLLSFKTHLSFHVGNTTECYEKAKTARWRESFSRVARWRTSYNFNIYLAFHVGNTNECYAKTNRTLAKVVIESRALATLL